MTEMTEVQKEIVKWKDGNILVTAAPGSGKTFVFVNRIAYLIKKHNVDPKSILALTFTKNAAEQMRNRLAKIIGKEVAAKVTMSTFHSFTYSQLKSHYPYKYNNRPIMADWFKLRTLYDIVGKQTSNNPNGMSLGISATDLSAFVSYQKSHMIQEGGMVLIDENTPYCMYEDRHRMQDAYDTYCRISRNSKSIEFDDMIMDFAIALEEDDTFLNLMIDKYKYVMVDEFQDTSNSNTDILKKINRNNLMVVGDVNQSIYSFINADVDMIIDFEDTFDNVTVKRLDRNYRSNHNVVELSNKIITASEEERFKKYAEQYSARLDIPNSPILLTTYPTEEEEVASVSKEIEDLIDENPGLELKDIAIISRTNATLGLFESELADRKIPVNISNGRSFFDKKEISDLISYANHALDESDDMSLRRIFNSPNRFISKKIMSDLDEFAYNNDITLSQAIQKYDGLGRSVKSMISITYLFEKLRNNIEVNAESFMRIVYRETKYEEFIEKTSKTHLELINKKESIEKFFDMAKRFRNVASFLSHISIIKENNTKTKDAVNLMTVHAAKGLEFSHVYGVGVNGESYPHDMSYNYEEERRLLYVLVSRAIQNLHLSSFVFKGETTIEASPFMIDAFGDEVQSARKDVMYGSSLSVTNLSK